MEGRGPRHAGTENRGPLEVGLVALVVQVVFLLIAMLVVGRLWPDESEEFGGAGMSTKLLQFPSRDGGSVVIEVAAPPSAAGEVTRGWGEKGAMVVDQAEQSFEQAVSRVQPAILGLLDQLRTLPNRPDAIQVEFGVQLSAEVGAFIAGASTSGNFKVSMTWRRQVPLDQT
jgi:hypothetical protein